MLLLTNGKILIERDNRQKDLDKNVKKLTKWLLEEKGIEATFLPSEEHNNLAYIIPEGITFDLMKECLASYIDLKAINETKFVLPYTKTIQEKYHFTDDELKEIAHENMRFQDEVDSLNSMLSVIKKEYAKEIEAVENQIRETKNRFQDGYEMRDYECEVHVDFDDRKKTFLNKNDGTVIRVDDLEDNDYKLQQLHIFDKMKVVPEPDEETAADEQGSTQEGEEQAEEQAAEEAEENDSPI